MELNGFGNEYHERRRVTVLFSDTFSIVDPHSFTLSTEIWGINKLIL